MMDKDAIFDILRSPVASVLSGVGISTKQQGEWHNLSECPWCGHGKDNGKNFQCGVREIQGPKGLLHSVKCFHPHDSATGEAKPHYADFLVAAGVILPNDAQQVKTADSSFASRAKAVRDIRSKAVAKSDLGRMNEENNAKARRRLHASPEALTWLTKSRGFSMETIARFKMGLSEPYKKEGAVVHSNALAVPLIGMDGHFYKKYVNYVIPGVTEKAGRLVDGSQKGDYRPWAPGEVRAYYNCDGRTKPWLFICDGLKDLWALDQLLRGSELAGKIALVSSTNGGGAMPSEWQQPEYWERFEYVFAGHDNDNPDALTGRRAGDEHATAIARVACGDVHRVTPPGVKDWNDWTLAGRTLDEFEALLRSSEVISVEEPIDEDNGQSLGRFSADPLSIVGKYHNGYLYEAVRLLKRHVDEATGEVVEVYDTVVLRSDRTQHRYKKMPAPKGTPEVERVMRLHPDGALLSVVPRPNKYLNWTWPSVDAWLKGKEKKTTLKNLLLSVQNHLRGSVWLPYEADFSILTCTVVASYVQEVFDAVPLLLVTGSKDTGKSALGEALRDIGANSAKSMLSVVTPAALARFIDDTRGLVVLDDLEKIGAGCKNDPQFDDMVQTLKVSYKKSTAVKVVIEFKNGEGYQRKFNFFGIKVINNTKGADDILGSRMLRITSRAMPAHVKIDKSLRLQPEALKEVCNQLHIWAFNNVKQVADAYEVIFPNKSGRQEEIAAPLRVIAALSGDETLSESLEKALDRQRDVGKDQFSPEEVLRESLESILRRSIEKAGVIPTWVSVAQVMYEAATLVDVNYGKDFTTSLALTAKPEWIGRSLLQHYVDEDAPKQRTTLFGKTLRAYKLSEDFISRTLKKISEETPGMFEKDVPRSDNFKLFCQACASCPYQLVCDIKQLRYPQGKKKRAAA